MHGNTKYKMVGNIRLVILRCFKFFYIQLLKIKEETKGTKKKLICYEYHLA